MQFTSTCKRDKRRRIKNKLANLRIFESAQRNAEQRGMGPTMVSLLAVDDYDATRANYVSLRDGRRAFAPQTYYDDFSTPAGVRDFHVAVEVPSAPTATTTSPVLREDLPLQRFGLPADLNGDGTIDDQSHTDDYRAIPIIVTFRWTTSTGAAEEMRLSTWVWGYR